MDKRFVGVTNIAYTRVLAAMVPGRVETSERVDMALDDVVRGIVDAAMECVAKLFAVLPRDVSTYRYGKESAHVKVFFP
jgi:hypothetical protein